MNLGKHGEEIKDITVKRSGDCMEARCPISILAFCWWERERELEHWGDCSALHSAGGLKKDRRECTKIQEYSAKLSENE